MAKLAFAFQNFYMQKRQLDQAHEKPEKPLDDEMGEFEDPFEDIEEEDEEVVVGGDDEDLEAAPESVYLPGQEIEKGHTLVADQSTYEFLHPMQVEWPCLSFDVVKDNLGLRSKYPMSSLIVAGSQADMPSANKIYIMKISNMYKTGEQDSDEEGSDDDDLDEDPILEYKTIPLNYGVNRIRISDNNMVAAMLDSGTVEIHDVSTHLQSLNVPGIIPAKDTLAHKITKHGSYEGYALDWSSNRLLTGDTKGRIYLTQSSANGWETEANAYLGHTSSVEDLQWSPSQSEVFCSCSADQTIRIWDARQKKPQITVKAHDSDVNVISWNRNVDYLLASGSDSGQFSVWDLRNISTSIPAASFTWHKAPITSISWHPTESSMLAVAGADDQLTIWDLALENDSEVKEQIDVPPQLLFIHQGQQHLKEIKHHPQIPGAIISTAYDGFNIFKTINS